MKRTNWLIIAVIVILIILLVYIGFTYLPNFFGDSDNELPQFGETQELNVAVGANRVTCNNGSGGECLFVDEMPFYQEIEDFNHQRGCVYELRIERYVAFNPDDAPIETSPYRHRLLEVVSRTC